MKASENCLELIRRFEGFRGTPYKCPAGVPTIGYGSTRYANGAVVTLQDAPITQAQADHIMKATLTEYEDAVRRYAQVPINQNQFDSLVDFAYNVGAKALLKSTLLRKLNAGDTTGASAEFAKWVKGGGVTLPGLVTRREAERVLFVKPMAV